MMPRTRFFMVVAKGDGRELFYGYEPINGEAHLMSSPRPILQEMDDALITEKLANAAGVEGAKIRAAQR